MALVSRPRPGAAQDPGHSRPPTSAASRKRIERFPSRAFCGPSRPLGAAAERAFDYPTVAGKFGPRICRLRGFRWSCGQQALAGCRPAGGAIVASNERESKEIARLFGHSGDCTETTDLGASAGCAGGAIHGRSQPRAAGGRGGARRARAGAGRRGHRQDARAHHPHCPHTVHGTRPRLRDPGRDLHQQGRARDEGAHRRARRRRRGGHAVARHLPRHRRQDPAPPCRARRPQVELHHPRHRRPDPPHQAGDRERGARQGPLAGASAGGPDRQLEEPRPHPRQSAARGGLRLRRGQGRRALCRLPEAAQGAQRCRLRRPAARGAAPVPAESRRARAIPAPLPLHAGRRVPGHQRRAVPAAAADRRPARPTSAASATTTSRSTAGAAPRSTTSCASSRTSPAPR